MNSSELVFNIIYTPYTAAYLSPLVSSLLQWSDCQYRLIANGCTTEDQQLLQDICMADARLEFVVAPGDQMIEHGPLLTWLQRQNKSPWFCCIDSDIFATGPFIESIKTYFKNHDAFFTGHPLWHAPEDIRLPQEFRRLHGIHFSTADGKALGGTYFAIYDNEILSEAINSTGVDFSTCRWEDVPEHHHATLRNAGLDKLEYDTGKLLTSLMYTQGKRFKIENLPAVCHLGGFSSRAADEPAYYYRGALDRITTELLGDLSPGAQFFLMDCWYALRRPSPGVTTEESKTLPFTERRLLEGRMRKRLNTARYFKALMQSLLANTPPPHQPRLGYAPADKRVAEATEKLTALYHDYFQAARK